MRIAIIGAGAAADVVVIDTGNYDPQRDGRLSGIEDDGVTESRSVERQLSHPVFKVFNNVYAANPIEAAQPADATDRTSSTSSASTQSTPAVCVARGASSQARPRTGPPPTWRGCDACSTRPAPSALPSGEADRRG
ncbi:hypothetical protein BH24ACT11_BH24ACT11_12150 [soil metagenome]